MVTRNQAKKHVEEEKKRNIWDNGVVNTFERSKRAIGRNDIIVDASRKKIKFEIEEEDLVVVKQERDEEEIPQPSTPNVDIDLIETVFVKEEVDIPNKSDGQQNKESESILCQDINLNVQDNTNPIALQANCGRSEDGIIPHDAATNEIKRLKEVVDKLTAKYEIFQHQLQVVSAENKDLKERIKLNDCQIEEMAKKMKTYESQQAQYLQRDPPVMNSINPETESVWEYVNWPVPETVIQKQNRPENIAASLIRVRRKPRDTSKLSEAKTFLH